MAQMITTVPSPSLLGLTYWGLSFLITVPLWFAADYFLYRRKIPRQPRGISMQASGRVIAPATSQAQLNSEAMARILSRPFVAIADWTRKDQNSSVPPEFGAAIKIITGTGAPFDFYRSHIHFKTHLVRVALVAERRLTNCELRVEKISGRLAQLCPVIVEKGFDLNPGVPKYIDFVAYDEGVSGPSLSSNHTIEAKFPINPLSNGVSYLDDQPYLLTLVASAAESIPYIADFRLWVDDAGHLKIEEVKEVLVSSRTPILELVKAAESAGWQFVGNRIVLHSFSQALRQAAMDGTIEIQGRPLQRRSDTKHALRNSMLEKIPPAYFKNHWIRLHYGWVDGNNNQFTTASDPLDKEPSYYIDLHVKRPEAWKWLSNAETQAARDRALALEADEKKRIADHPIRTGEDEGKEIE
ncbi:MAG: hypothetical protein WCA78_16105 [Rhizomicrobium sp.]